VELRKWPRRNDPDSIRARQDALDGRVDPEVFGDDLSPWARAQEALTGLAVIPVAVIGPLTIELGEYELEEPAGTLRETGRAVDEVFVPLAHRGEHGCVALPWRPRCGGVRRLQNVRPKGQDD
jgi:hypothetical protein